MSQTGGTIRAKVLRRKGDWVFENWEKVQSNLGGGMDKVSLAVTGRDLEFILRALGSHGGIKGRDYPVRF